MRLPKTTLGVAISTIAIFALQVPLATPASAVPGCAATHAHVGGTWQPAADWVYGLRGPVQARRDGTTCTNGGSVAYIGIQSGLVGLTGGELAQIGYFRWHDASANPPTTKFCLFSEDVPQDSTPVAYLCSTNANDVYEWVEVVESGAYMYTVDCGVSDPVFGSCENVEAVNVSDFAGLSFAQQIDESFNAVAPNCVVQIMGSSSDPDNIGSTAKPVQGKISSGDTWQPRVTNHYYDGPSGCTSDYVGTVVDHGVVTAYDSRNAS